MRRSSGGVLGDEGQHRSGLVVAAGVAQHLGQSAEAFVACAVAFRWDCAAFHRAAFILDDTCDLLR